MVCFEGLDFVTQQGRPQRIGCHSKVIFNGGKLSKFVLEFLLLGSKHPWRANINYVFFLAVVDEHVNKIFAQ